MNPQKVTFFETVQQQPTGGFVLLLFLLLLRGSKGSLPYVVETDAPRPHRLKEKANNNNHKNGIDQLILSSPYTERPRPPTGGFVERFLPTQSEVGSLKGIPNLPIFPVLALDIAFWANLK